MEAATIKQCTIVTSAGGHILCDIGPQTFKVKEKIELRVYDSESYLIHRHPLAG
jgi:hypothetical protein